MKKITILNNAALKQERNIFGDMIQSLAVEKLVQLGYEVKSCKLNDGHNKIDLDATKDNNRILFEVKGSRLRQSGRRGKRYRATLPKQCLSDILLFCCYSDNPIWFVIPICEIYPNRHVSVWSVNPLDYKGKWAKFIEKWNLLDDYEF